MRMKTIHSAAFTLIELIIAIAIIGLLAAVAFPAYTDQIRKSKRADLVTDIMQCAAVLERRFTVRSTYETTACDNIANDDYSLTVAVSCVSNGRNNCYTITATPSSGFASDDKECASFRIDHLGERTAKTNGGSTNTQDCWNT